MVRIIGAMRGARELVPSGDNPELRTKFELIVSMYDPSIELTPQEVGKRFNISLAGTIPAAWDLLANSHNLGMPLVMSAPSSRYARAIRKLAGDLLCRLSANEPQARTTRPRLTDWFGVILRKAG